MYIYSNMINIKIFPFYYSRIISTKTIEIKRFTSTLKQNFCKNKSAIVLARNYSSGFDSNLGSLQRYKKVFALCLFSSTILMTWFLKKNKLKKMQQNLEDCFKISVEGSLFGSKIDLYRYHEFIFPGQLIMSGVFQMLPNFEFRKDDLIVASFPKSGTTWVQEVVYMLTHEFKKTDVSSEVLETRFPYLEYPYPGIKAVSLLTGMRLIKTHLPYTLLPDSFFASGAKLIYIIRNPRDVAVSYWHFMKLLTTVNFTGTFEDFVQMFISEKVPYGPYFDHLKSYIEHKGDDNILILSYEDLKANPFCAIKEIADFIQIPITDSEVYSVAVATSFRAMSDNPSVNYEHWKDIGFAHKDKGSFLRKGAVGDWKNYFTLDLLNLFKEWEVKNAEKVDFSIKYELTTEKENLSQ